MRKFFIGAIIMILIAGGAWIAFRKPTPSPAPTTNTTDPLLAAQAKIAKPWIEITAPTVTARRAGAATTTNRTLASGDELERDDVVETDQKGRATIHFPEGSKLRMDSGTTITINAAEYHEEDGGLTAKISLTVGRVWSKIIELATPDSIWEVKTSNAVATVRGTAFGMGFRDGRSRIFGSERTVRVNPINEKTGAIIEIAQATIEPNTFIEFKTPDIASFEKNPEKFRAKATTQEFLKDTWLIQNKAEDQKIDDLIRELQETHLDRRDIKSELKKTVEAAREKEREQYEQKQKETPHENPQSVTPPRGQTPATGRGNETETGNRLEIIPANLKEIQEGEVISFRLILIPSTGGRRDITREASWRVLGPVGRITAGGVFTAELDASTAEFGEGSGAIVAAWNSQTAETQIFKVRGKVDNTPPQGRNNVDTPIARRALEQKEQHAAREAELNAAPVAPAPRANAPVRSQPTATLKARTPLR